MIFSRRDFLATAAVSSLSLGLPEGSEAETARAEDTTNTGKLPIIICANS